VAKLDEGAMINSPFYMEFANHLEMGVNSFINYDCIMLNNAMVKLGDNVLVGPKVSFYTAIIQLTLNNVNNGLYMLSQ